MTHGYVIRCLNAALLSLFWLATALGAGNVKTDGQFISTEPTAPPLAVSSSTKVDNLNADLLDGMSAADFFTQDQAMVRRVVFPNAGNTIFVVPSGVTSLQVTVIGGGGGGGGADDFAGGGGGGSGLVITTTVLVSGGDNLSVQVGAGGLGGSPFLTDPGDPGEASILSGPTGWRVEADGGLGGEGSGISDGGDGGDGQFGGGGGEGDASDGLGGDGIFADGEDAAGGSAGDGASGGSGGGFRGGGGGGGPGGGNSNSPGSQPGAGGGGGNSFSSGGAGADGAIVIEWFGPPLPN